MEQFKIISMFAYVMFTLGLISLAASALYASSVLVFIGLGLTFWSIILLYITPTKYVKLELLNAIAHPTPTYIENAMANVNPKGKAIYLPPKYLEDYESTVIFIPIKADQSLPQTRDEKVAGMFLTPPGLALSELFEKTLGTSFTRTDLTYLQHNLPKLFIKTLRIAKDIDLLIESNTITIEIADHIFAEICQDTRNHQKIYESIGCPLCSALACALAEATGTPITIENIQPSADGTIIEATYRLLETPRRHKTVGTTSEVIERHLSRLAKPVSLILIGFGSAILVWICWLTWYDMTTWGKDLALIFFGSRTGEAISLGTDLRVIHYLLIGLASFVTGVITFLRASGHWRHHKSCREPQGSASTVFSLCPFLGLRRAMTCQKTKRLTESSTVLLHSNLRNMP